jgi:hypothetical protein
VHCPDLIYLIRAILQNKIHLRRNKNVKYRFLILSG